MFIFADICESVISVSVFACDLVVIEVSYDQTREKREKREKAR